MEMNISTISLTMDGDDLLNKYMRPINFILSCTGLVFNFLLMILLLSIGRRQCATYFLLILMTICDFLYCTVYVSISLTIDQFINIINHQIICPLSFFLTPFTFTGSTLLLFVCLLHFITNYVRKYETILGQISGRLSVVFVLAFIIIRSVLGSTSIELVIPDPKSPHIQLCTVHMNTTTIVATVQKINYIFAEVTDILVYIGWIIILSIYLITLLRCRSPSLLDQRKPTLSSMVPPLSYPSLLVNHGPSIVTTTRYSFEMPNETTMPTVSNKERHNDVTLIILSISLISVIFYSPIMISKYITMHFVYRHRTLLTEEQTYFLQISQHAAHLFCLSIRFLPYLMFDKRIHAFLNQIIGMKCMKIERRKTLSRRRRKHKYTWHCYCHRRQQILEFTNNNDDEHKYLENTVIKN